MNLAGECLLFQSFVDAIVPRSAILTATLECRSYGPNPNPSGLTRTSHRVLRLFRNKSLRQMTFADGLAQLSPISGFASMPSIGITRICTATRFCTVNRASTEPAEVAAFVSASVNDTNCLISHLLIHRETSD